ncbi:MAG: response regulator transcription factor [Chloroflexi bacterium]|nr:response regulator transcription factor [Chloroflexota bacterium]
MHPNLYPIGDPRRTRILLVDNHAVFRAGLRAILAEQTDLEVVGEAADAAQALYLARRLQPDVVLLTLVSERDGVAVISQLRADVPGMEIVILTNASENEDLVVAAVRAGAIGYLRKDAAVGQVLDAINAAARGQAYLTPQAAARLMREVRRADAPMCLSDREREVLRMLGLGWTNKEVGHALSIAESTVKTHVSAILGKLGVQSRTQAALYAVQHGLAASADLTPARGMRVAA